MAILPTPSMPGWSRAGGLLEPRLHPEVVAAVARRGHRGDLLHHEAERAVRGGGQQQLTMLAHRHVGDVTLVDLEGHAERIERSDVKERLASFDGRAERLTQVAADHDAIEARDDATLGELFIDQGQLGARLIDLGGGHGELGGVAGGERLVLLLHELILLRGPFRPLQAQLAVVQRNEQLATVHQIAWSHGGVAYVAVERRDRDALHVRLHDRPRRHAILAGREHQKGDHGDSGHRAELGADVARANEMCQLSAARVERLGDQPPIVSPQSLEHWARQPGHRLDELHHRVVEGPDARTLQGQGAHDPCADRERDGEDGGTVLVAELPVGACRTRHRVGRGRMEHRALLIDRLVHGRADGADEIGAMAQLGGVRHGLHVNAGAADESETHAITAELRRQRGDEGDRRGGEALVVQRAGDRFEHIAQAVTGGVLLGGVTARDKHLEPAGTPLQMSEHHLQAGVRTHGHVDGDHADDAALRADRAAQEVVAAPGRIRGRRLTYGDAACLGDGATRQLGQRPRIFGGVAPERDRRDAARPVARETEDGTAEDAWNEPALRGQPALIEGFRRGRLAEVAPGRRPGPGCLTAGLLNSS